MWVQEGGSPKGWVWNCMGVGARGLKLGEGEGELVGEEEFVKEGGKVELYIGVGGKVLYMGVGEILILYEGVGEIVVLLQLVGVIV